MYKHQISTYMSCEQGKLVSNHESRTHDSAGEVASCQSVYVVVFVLLYCMLSLLSLARFDFDTCYITI